MIFRIKGQRLTKDEKAQLKAQGQKYCPSCKLAKAFEHFPLDASTADGYGCYCTKCNLENYKEAVLSQPVKYVRDYKPQKLTLDTNKAINWWKSNKHKVAQKHNDRRAIKEDIKEVV